MNPGLRIAGTKTVADWQARKKLLEAKPSPADWTAAACDFLQGRVESRYLSVVRQIQRARALSGEGFAIMAIHCTLVEFLESTVEGLTYQYRAGAPDPARGKYTYGNSSDVFCAFLTRRSPFNKHFDDARAGDFYRSVRCGLLHEARTKGPWRILAQGPNGTIVDGTVVYRDEFQRGLEQFIEDYCSSLGTDPDRQAAFIRKYDSLCD